MPLWLASNAQLEMMLDIMAALFEQQERLRTQQHVVVYSVHQLRHLSFFVGGERPALAEVYKGLQAK